MHTKLLLANMELISNFGSWIYPYVVISFLFSFYLFKRKLYKKSLLILTTLGSYVYSVLLKSFFKLPRPSTSPPLLKIRFGADLYGFPSSHTIVYTVFWGFMLYLTYTLDLFKDKKALRYTTQFLSVYFLTFVGASRIYLGYHSIKDVLGGYVFGIAFLLVLILIDLIQFKAVKQ